MEGRADMYEASCRFSPYIRGKRKRREREQQVEKLLAVSCRLLIAQVWVRFRTSLGETCSKHSGNLAVFSAGNSFRFSHVTTVPPMLHAQD